MKPLALALIAVLGCKRAPEWITSEDAAVTTAEEKPSASPSVVPNSRLAPHIVPDVGKVKRDVTVRASLGTCVSMFSKVVPCERFEIENVGNASLDLDYELVIENHKDGTWSYEQDIQKHMITADCEANWPPAPPRPCATLHPGAKLTPHPWLGWYCRSMCRQCGRTVHSLRSGTYRAVVRSCDRAQRFEGKPFEWTDPEH